MAKFIIEVSDGYIYERANVENITQNYENDFKSGMVELLSFSNLEQKLKEGETEFNLSSTDFMENEDMVGLFNKLMTHLAGSLLAIQVVGNRKKE